MGKSLITGGGASSEASGPRADAAAQRRSAPAGSFAPNVILSSALADDGGARLSRARFFLDADQDAFCGGQGALRKVWTEDGKGARAEDVHLVRGCPNPNGALFKITAISRFCPREGSSASWIPAMTRDIVEAPCIVMEWIDGVSLSRYLIANGPMTVEQVLETLAKVIEFSAFAWDGARNRLVDHDIKPDNILIETVDSVLRPRPNRFRHFLRAGRKGSRFGNAGFFAPPGAVLLRG